MRTWLVTLVWLSAALPSASLSLAGLSRRQLLHALTGSAVAVPTGAAVAFENALPEATKYADRPKRRGTPPKDIGLKLREDPEGDLGEIPVLKNCPGPAPNCFSTTSYDELDAASLVPPWKPPKGQPREKSLEQISAAISEYQPGQSGIDGGGFKVVANNEDGYFYVTYESLRNGYIDDFECALNEAGSSMMVRSSSRVGYLDFGVNAKRLNGLALPLKKAGWDIALISPASHADYCTQNAGGGFSPQQTCEAVAQ